MYTQEMFEGFLSDLETGKVTIEETKVPSMIIQEIRENLGKTPPNNKGVYSSTAAKFIFERFVNIYKIFEKGGHPVPVKNPDKKAHYSI